MKTDNKNITRDYISPKDLHQLIMKLVENDFLNTSVDCFTKDPTDKFSILELMKSQFGLKYEIIFDFLRFESSNNNLLAISNVNGMASSVSLQA